MIYTDKNPSSQWHRFWQRLKQDVTEGNPLTKKFVRYNTTEIVISAPEFRWPNKGYYRIQGGKKILMTNSLSLSGQYINDDRSLP